MTEDPLLSAHAGNRAIRGSMLRTGGYLVGLLLTAVTAVFLLRYLGPVDFGRYTVVVSIVAIVGGLSDVGLTIVGQREYVLRTAVADRRRLLADLVGIRLGLTPVGVLLGAAFAFAVGYPRVVVLGTLLAGAGLVLANVAATVTLPLSTRLALGAVTATELVRQAAIMVGIGVLVAVGADLLPFFAVHIAAGAVALATALAFTGRREVPPPRFAPSQWRPLLVQAAPVAAAQVVNVTYVRTLVLVMSLLATGVETGLFAASYRIIEMLVAIPALMVGSAFPILAHAGATDERRLAYALQRLGEVACLLAGLMILVLVLGAGPIIELLGGSEYEGSADVLRIQAFALLGAFLAQVWALGLVATHRQRALVTINVVSLAVVLILGIGLVPVWGAEGAAVAAAVGEAILAVTALILLTRARPALRPDLRYAPKLAAAAGVAALVVLVPGLPQLAAAALAGLIYLAVAWMLRAIPLELAHALRARPGSPAA